MMAGEAEVPRMFRRYVTTSDLAGTIAIFPLSGTLLLPRSILPLNIFEPRYLKMVDDSMRGTRLIGMVQPRAREKMTFDVSCATAGSATALEG